MLIIGVYGPRKANALVNLINHQQDVKKIYLYAKDSFEAKYQFLIKKREITGLKYLNGSTVFIEYSINMDGIYDNIEEYNPNKK